MEGKVPLCHSSTKLFSAHTQHLGDLVTSHAADQSLVECYTSYFLIYFSIIPESIRKGGKNKRQAYQ